MLGISMREIIRKYSPALVNKFTEKPKAAKTNRRAKFVATNRSCLLSLSIDLLIKKYQIKYTIRLYVTASHPVEAYLLSK